MNNSRSKQIIRNIFKLNIRQKLILTYVLIVALPLAILQVNAFHRIRVMTEKEYINNVNFEVSKLKNDVVKNLEQFIKATQFILNNQEFIDFVSTYQEKTTDEIFSFKINVLDKIEYLQYVNFNINRIRFFTNNQFIPEMWPTLYQADRLKTFKFIDKFLSEYQSYFIMLLKLII
ncbi:MAG: hypothetical protein QXI16_00415 [Sulfolobaceae archaeon]